MASSAGGTGAAWLGPRRRRLQVLALDVGHRLGAERVLPGDQVIEHDAQRVDVGARVDAVAANLLGRHRVRRAEPGADDGQPALARVGVQQLGDAEVQQLDHALAADLGDEDVARLEVAVDDAEIVRRLQRGADRLQNLQHLAGREAPALVQHRPQVDALEQLHHVERAPVGQIVELEDVDDARVLDHVDGARFLHEARDHLRRRRELPAQHLDRGAPAEDPVLRLVDGAAAAGGELLLQDVGAGQRPRLQRVGVDGRAVAGRRDPDSVRAPWSCRSLQISATRLCVPPPNREDRAFRVTSEALATNI